MMDDKLTHSIDSATQIHICNNATATTSNFTLPRGTAITYDTTHTATTQNWMGCVIEPTSAGENSGVTLSHDHVVREWIGPIALMGGQAELKRAVTLRSNWNRAELGVVGFVQNMQTGHVLQAVGASECLRS